MWFVGRQPVWGMVVLWLFITGNFKQKTNIDRIVQLNIFVVKYFRYPERNITNTHTLPFPLHLHVAAFAPGLPVGTADTGPGHWALWGVE